MAKEKWITTDSSCNQKMLCITRKQVYVFQENRIVNPLTHETELFKATLFYSNYSNEELINACEPFGYTAKQVSNWIKKNKNISLMLECIFEML